MSTAASNVMFCICEERPMGVLGAFLLLYSCSAFTFSHVLNVIIIYLQEPEWLASGLEALVCILAKEALKSSTSSCSSSGQYKHDRLMSLHAMTGEQLLSSLLDLSREVVSKLKLSRPLFNPIPHHNCNNMSPTCTTIYGLWLLRSTKLHTPPSHNKLRRLLVL